MTASAIPHSGEIPTLATACDAGERLRIRMRSIGALVMGSFGALWSAAGLALSSAPAWAWTVLAIVFLAFGVRALQLRRETPPAAEPLPAAIAERRRRGNRIFAWTSFGEGLGIFLAVNIVANLGHPQWQPAAAMLVVGLHFFPQVSAFSYRPHAVTGVAMTAWALAYPWLFAAGAMAPAGMLGAGAILFASAAWALRSAAAKG